jgi:hypothetical protein
MRVKAQSGAASVFPSYDMRVKAQSGAASVVPTRSQAGDGMRSVVNTMVRPLYDRSGSYCTESRVILSANLGGTGNLSPPGFNPHIVQSVANRYTDCAIAAAFNSVFLFVLFE